MPRDKLVWAATPNGKFTVKSAYWLALDMKRVENESTSGPSGLQQLWRSIWSADVPNKIKNFAWRACQNTLPTKANLFHRKVISSEVCEHCDQGMALVQQILNLLTSWPSREIYGTTGMGFDMVMCQNL
ncbi:hypothetical protein SO802_012269 [Lithocarpus litseifolius]|uniref:Reverse transcriptase zinc-binding domain-containing protein n=1 Tax=Lithocarpus litseifolius TaxID=425828 RepID=A0AAW2D4R1_9ROSI